MRFRKLVVLKQYFGCIPQNINFVYNVLRLACLCSIIQEENDHYIPFGHVLADTDIFILRTPSQYISYLPIPGLNYYTKVYSNGDRLSFSSKTNKKQYLMYVLYFLYVLFQPDIHKVSQWHVFKGLFSSKTFFSDRLTVTM